MPITTRSTVTTSRGGATTEHTVIPMWTIKLVTAILSIVVLVLVMLHGNYMWQAKSERVTQTVIIPAYPRTFICIVLSNGYLLGWSLPSVLNRFLPFHKVDVALHSFSTALATVALILVAIFLIDRSDYSRTDDWKMMLGIGICCAVEVILLFILISWVCYGNYTIVDTR